MKVHPSLPLPPPGAQKRPLEQQQQQQVKNLPPLGAGLQQNSFQTSQLFQRMGPNPPVSWKGPRASKKALHFCTFPTQGKAGPRISHPEGMPSPHSQRGRTREQQLWGQDWKDNNQAHRRQREGGRIKGTGQGQLPPILHTRDPQRPPHSHTTHVSNNVSPVSIRQASLAWSSWVLCCCHHHMLMEFGSVGTIAILQRIHHTIGQHSHLPSHRLDTLLKLGNVSCGEHIPQRYASCSMSSIHVPKEV